METNIAVLRRLALAIGASTVLLLGAATAFQQLPQIGDTFAPGTIQYFALSDDGRFAVVAGYVGEIFSLDLSTGKRQTLVKRYPYGVSAMAISPRSAVAAIGNHDEIVVISLRDGDHRVRKIETAPEIGVEGLAFSPDGRLLAPSSSRSPYIPVWDLATGLEVKRLQPCGGRSQYIAFSADGRELAASCDPDNIVRIWDLATSRRVRDMSVGPGAWVNWVRFGGDGRRVIAATGGTNSIEIFDACSGGLLSSLKGHTDQVDYFVLPTNDQLISASDDETVRVWDMNTASLQRTLAIRAPDGVIAEDGSFVLLDLREDEPGVLELWDVRTERKIRTFHVWSKPGNGGLDPLLAVKCLPAQATSVTGSDLLPVFGPNHNMSSGLVSGPLFLYEPQGESSAACAVARLGHAPS